MYSKEKISMKSNKYNYNLKYVIFGHIFLFILFLGELKEDNTSGLERIIVTFILSLIIAYGITLNFKKSSIAALSFTLLVGLLDSKGPFNDYITEYSRYQKYPSKKNCDACTPMIKYGIHENKRIPYGVAIAFNPLSAFALYSFCQHIR